MHDGMSSDETGRGAVFLGCLVAKHFKHVVEFGCDLVVRGRVVDFGCVKKGDGEFHLTWTVDYDREVVENADGIVCLKATGCREVIYRRELRDVMRLYRTWRDDLGDDNGIGVLVIRTRPILATTA